MKRYRDAHDFNPFQPLPLVLQCEALHIVILDVTKPDQVQAAADRVEAENPQGLYALVNNAGRWNPFLWLISTAPTHPFCLTKPPYALSHT